MLILILNIFLHFCFDNIKWYQYQFWSYQKWFSKRKIINIFWLKAGSNLSTERNNKDACPKVGSHFECLRQSCTKQGSKVGRKTRKASVRHPREGESAPQGCCPCYGEEGISSMTKQFALCEESPLLFLDSNYGMKYLKLIARSWRSDGS